MRKILTVLAFGISSLGFSAGKLAVIDSGLDTEHQALKAMVWVNTADPVNGKDDDSNGYIDDINGWNFAEGSGVLLDKKYIGTFSTDCYKFFDVQGRLLTGTATAEDREWYKAKIQDQAFIKELTKFGNFTHGTHVAGIGTKETTNVSVMGVKLIPTEQRMREWKPDGTGDFLILMLLKMSADNNIKLMKQIAEYVQKEDMHVANCSFGISEKAARQLIRQQLEGMNEADISDERVNRLAKTFLQDMLVTPGKDAFGKTAPGVLWVYAAGNDGSNNSELATFPANVKVENSISVAASVNTQALASFSNYRADLVEVAAPGVVIRSTIPGNEYLTMSGTSQAAPFVANVAVQIKAINEKLTPAGIKTILMQTVDKKDWLANKVKSSGIVNKARALEAANLTKEYSLTEAIRIANETVPAYILPTLPVVKDIYILPLPSPIIFN